MAHIRTVRIRHKGQNFAQHALVEPRRLSACEVGNQHQSRQSIAQQTLCVLTGGKTEKEDDTTRDDGIPLKV